MTRSATTFLTLALVVAAFGFSPAVARDAAISSPALWKVEGPNGTVYFFGSIHLLPKGLVWHGPELLAALSQAQELVFETDVEEAAREQGRRERAATFGFLNPGESLHKMVAPEYRERLDTVANSFGMDPELMDRMRPWLAAITLNSFSLTSQGAGPNSSDAIPLSNGGGVDEQLWRWAKAAGKERGVLETADDQVRVFADLPREQEIELLIVMLENAKRSSETLGTMIDAWKTGDTSRLDRAFNSYLDRFPSLRDALMRDRHKKWLPQIERMLADGRTHVIVVGTAHLVGKNNLVAMLRAEGVKVEGP